MNYTQEIDKVRQEVYAKLAKENGEHPWEEIRKLQKWAIYRYLMYLTFHK